MAKKIQYLKVSSFKTDSHYVKTFHSIEELFEYINHNEYIPNIHNYITDAAGNLTGMVISYENEGLLL